MEKMNEKIGKNSNSAPYLITSLDLAVSSNGIIFFLSLLFPRVDQLHH